MTQRKSRTKNVPANMKRAEIRAGDGQVIYRGPERIGNRFKPYDLEIRTKIISSVGRLEMRLGTSQQEAWWQETQRACQHFVVFDNLENIAYPTARQLAQLVSAAENFVLHIKPLLDVDGEFDTGAADALIYVDHILKRVRAGGYLAPFDRKHSGLHLIQKLGSLYIAAFGRMPSTDPSGPFVRFVQACVEATDWHTKIPTGATIQGHIRKTLKEGGFAAPPPFVA